MRVHEHENTHRFPPKKTSCNTLEPSQSTATHCLFWFCPACQHGCFFPPCFILPMDLVLKAPVFHHFLLPAFCLFPLPHSSFLYASFCLRSVPAHLLINDSNVVLIPEKGQECILTESVPLCIMREVQQLSLHLA